MARKLAAVPSSQSKKKTSTSHSKKLSGPKTAIIGASVRGSTKATQRRSQRSGKAGKQIEQADENEDEAEVEAEVAAVNEDDDEDEDEVATGTLTSDEVPPTIEEWKTMKPFPSFIVKDPDDKVHHFYKKDIVLVIPEDMRRREPGKETDLLRLWVAQIVQIRAKRAEDHENMWCKVQWYYNKNHFAEYMEQTHAKIAFNPNRCGKQELISTDHESFVSVMCIDDKVDVVSFNENDLNQKDITGLYKRTQYQFNTNKLQTPRSTCKPGKSLCKRPYDPDADIQYYCPPCERWYHDQCLENAHWGLTPAATRKLSADPAILITKSLPPPSEDRPEKQSPRRSSRKRNSTASQVQTSATQSPDKRVSRIKVERDGSTEQIEIPASLLEIAKQQIIRGGDRYGIVGNARAVCAARELLKDMTSGEKDLADLGNWKELVGARYVRKWEMNEATSPRKKISVKYYRCEHCNNIM